MSGFNLDKIEEISIVNNPTLLPLFDCSHLICDYNYNLLLNHLLKYFINLPNLLNKVDDARIILFKKLFF